MADDCEKEPTANRVVSELITIRAQPEFSRMKLTRDVVAESHHLTIRKDWEQAFVMTKLTCSFFLAAALLSSLPAHRARRSRSAATRLQVGGDNADSQRGATCQKDSDGVKVTGTVVIAITIDKSGKVSHPHTVSGPKMLRPLATATVLKYRYKPYLLNGTPIQVGTVVSIPINCFFHTGQA